MQGSNDWTRPQISRSDHRGALSQVCEHSLSTKGSHLMFIRLDLPDIVLPKILKFRFHSHLCYFLVFLFDYCFNFHFILISCMNSTYLMNVKSLWKVYTFLFGLGKRNGKKKSSNLT